MANQSNESNPMGAESATVQKVEGLVTGRMTGDSTMNHNYIFINNTFINTSNSPLVAFDHGDRRNV